MEQKAQNTVALGKTNQFPLHEINLKYVTVNKENFGILSIKYIVKTEEDHKN